MYDNTEDRIEGLTYVTLPSIEADMWADENDKVVELGLTPEGAYALVEKLTEEFGENPKKVFVEKVLNTLTDIYGDIDNRGDTEYALQKWRRQMDEVVAMVTETESLSEATKAELVDDLTGIRKCAIKDTPKTRVFILTRRAMRRVERVK